jgi:hypothetical protein
MAKRKMVKCYRLDAALDAAEMEPLRPFLRETFSETWDALMYEGPGAIEGQAWWRAYRVLRDAGGPGVHSSMNPCRFIEAALYRRAVARGGRPVMHAGRR